MNDVMHWFAKLLEGMFLIGMAGSALVIIATIIEAVRVVLRPSATPVD